MKITRTSCIFMHIYQGKIFISVAGFSLKVVRGVENHSAGANFPLMWST